MPIDAKVVKYSVWVSQNNILGWVREIGLVLESGATVYIGFPQQRPADWLQFVGQNTNLFMTEDEFDDVYHVLQTEPTVYFTALNVVGLQVGAVHTAPALSEDADTGETDLHPSSTAALVRRAKRTGTGA
jgi:hypothetical protein